MRLLTGFITVVALMLAGALLLVLVTGQLPTLAKPLLCPDGEYQASPSQIANPEFPSERIANEQLLCMRGDGVVSPVNASSYATGLLCLTVIALLVGLGALFQLATSAGNSSSSIVRHDPAGGHTQPSDRAKPAGSPPDAYAGPAQQAALLSPAVRDEALALLAKNKKIEAIKRVRQETGLGLKESKELVEWLEMNNERL